MQKAIADNAIRTTVENLEAWYPKVAIDEMQKGAEDQARANMWQLKKEALVKELQELGVVVEERLPARETAQKDSPTRTFERESGISGHVPFRSAGGRAPAGS